jgi:hypothetical protein
MNKVSDENESFDSSDLILAQPTISDNSTLKKPAIGGDSLFKLEQQPAIGGDSLFKLEQPAISDNLMQMLLHYLIPPDLNRNNETSR